MMDDIGYLRLDSIIRRGKVTGLSSIKPEEIFHSKNQDGKEIKGCFT